MAEARLQDRTALVTGSDSGIGHVTAIAGFVTDGGLMRNLGQGA